MLRPTSKRSPNPSSQPSTSINSTTLEPWANTDSIFDLSRCRSSTIGRAVKAVSIVFHQAETPKALGDMKDATLRGPPSREMANCFYSQSSTLNMGELRW